MPEITHTLHNKFDHWKQIIEDDPTTDFIRSLGIMKVMLIVTFIMITIIYFEQEQKLINSGNVHVYTLLHSTGYLKKLMIASSMDALFGILTFITIVGNRGGIRNLPGNIIKNGKTIALLSVILFMFRFSQESSGFNRWMSPNAAIYQELDQVEMAQLKQQMIASEGNVLSEAEMSKINAKLQKLYSKGENNLNKAIEYESPFGIAVEKTAIGVFALIMIFYSIKICIATFYGYKSEKTWMGINHISHSGFCIELFIMFLFNAIPSLMAPKIYGVPYASSDVMMAFGMGGFAAFLHVMFQYGGLYQGLSGNGNEQQVAENNEGREEGDDGEQPVTGWVVNEKAGD